MVTKSGPNTAAFIYLDTPALKANCQKEKDKIEKECKPRDPNKPSAMEKLAGEKAAAKIRETKDKIGKAANAPPWLMDHCDGLMLKPMSSQEIAEIGASLKNMTSDDILRAAGQQLDDAVKVLDQAVKDVAVAAAEKAALKAAGRWGAGAIFGPIGEIVATAINVVDGVVTAVDVAQQVGALRDEIAGLRDVIKELPNKLKEIAQTAKTEPQKAVADTMSILSRLDDCVRARRCQLVPMKETHNGTTPKCDDFDDPHDPLPSGPASGKGCCPGQTGHHVLPGAMFKNCAAYSKGGSGGCPHQNAPTVCVEGVNNSHGSHGAMHGQLDKQMKKYKSGNISLDDAIEEGADSVRKVFPESGCSTKCLEAQLKEFYEKYKNCSPLKANPGTSGQTGSGKDK